MYVIKVIVKVTLQLAEAKSRRREGLSVGVQLTSFYFGMREYIKKTEKQKQKQSKIMHLTSTYKGTNRKPTHVNITSNTQRDGS